MTASQVKDDIEFLKNVPILSDLEAMDLETIVKVGVRKKYKKGSIILLEEEAGAALFVIASGKVKIVRMDDDGREVILSILGESDFFGEMALLDGKTSPATVSAMEDCRVATIFNADFQHLLMSNEKVVRQIIQVLCARLRQVWSAPF